MEITVEMLKTTHPDIYAAILEEGYKKGLSEGEAKGRDEGFRTGSDKERERIKGIEQGALPGHDALVTQMKFDGQTTPEQAAVRIVQAEMSLRETKLADTKMDAPPVVPSVDAVKTEPAKAVATDGPMTEEQMKSVWDSDAGLRADFSGDFDAYKAFTEANQAGLVKIYGKKGGK